MTKRSKLAAIITMRCPKCHEGHLFENPNSYVFKDVSKMNAQCPKCGENFKREPGFYFGAAYVSYGLTVALWIAVAVALIIFDAIGLISYGFFENPITFFLSGVVSLVVLLPFLYRHSRTLWIHMFVKYDERALQKGKDTEGH